MANAFGDQLLKAGLVTKKQVKKVQQKKYQQAKKQRKTKVVKVDENKLRLKQEQAKKIARDKALNHQKNIQAEKKAITAQIKQLIQLNQQEKSHNKNPEDDIAYNFVETVDNKQQIKTIHISDNVKNALSAGLLAIAKLEEHYELVPKAIAEKIKLRDDSIIILLNEKTQQTNNDTNEEDPYADYQIPDDLMW